MKNSTSLLFKLFLFSLLLLASINKASAFGAGDFTLVSENTTDGDVTVKLTCYNGGNKVGSTLYWQVNIDGVWTNLYSIVQTHETCNNGLIWPLYSEWNCNWLYTPSKIGSNISDSWTTPGTTMQLRMTASPTGVYNSPVSFRVVDGSSVVHNVSLTFYRPDAPTGLTVSRNECNKIDLSWTAPSNKRAGTSIYEIRRGTNTYVTQTTSTSYSWTGPSDGADYDFKVRLITDSNYGVYSSSVQGNSKAKPEPPTNVIASTDRCDGTVKVDWQWSAATPANFMVQRSTNSYFNANVVTYTVAGSQYYYEDTPPNVNTIYYYRVRTKNDCNDWGVYSTGIDGYSPAAPADPSNIDYTVSGNIIQLTWNDNSFNETKFLIRKTNLITGVTNDYETDANVTFYDDDAAQLCIPYKYEIEAVNDCGSSSPVASGDVLLTPDLDNTFPAGSFKASKGFYPDIVHLEWDNNNRNQINAYYVYRKVFGSTDSTLLTTLDGALASYDDEYAENGILYEYSIQAEGLCDTVSVWSNMESDIGFRNPAATVSGKITYGTGEPVEGITITAESDDELITTSLAFNGTNSYLEIPDNSGADIQNNFAFQAYVRLSQIQNSAIFNKGNQYKLNYTGSAFEFSVGGNVLSYSYTLAADIFIHVSAVFDGSTSSLYLDGKLVATKETVSAVANNSSAFVLGKYNSSNYLSGYIDEVRIWKEAIDSTQIKNNYRRYISYRNADLVGYYRLNENIDFDMFFDISKSNLSFNENHGSKYNCNYSTVVPDREQLWFRGLSDQNGDYLITGIPYFTDGSSFNIVPTLAPHEFNPSSKTLFLSDESQVHNNIDFIDKSSFMVNGSVKYRNTNLGVAGVQLLVDGALVFGPNAKPEVTDENGVFEILVPIGYHYISLVKDGHEFDNGGRYPYEEAYPDSIVRHNFIQNLTFGESFIDTTLITVVGRLIGGTGSNQVPFGFGQSVNNIGAGTLTFDHSSSNPELTFDNEGDALGANTLAYSVVTSIDSAGIPSYEDIEHFSSRTDMETQIYTSPTTGEFVAKLIPEKFAIVEVKVNGNTGNEVRNFFGNRVIDLSVNPSKKMEYLYDEDDNLLDSLEYHVKLNYVYQTVPEISVTNVDETDVFYGEELISFTNPSTGASEDIVVADNFNYPIFKMFASYSPEISIFESYEYYGTLPSGFEQFTRQSVKEAQIKIINDLAIQDKVKSYELEPAMDGVIVDNFTAGIPNISKSEGDGTSFTKTMQINVTVDGNTFSWKPGGEFYRAYIIGQRPKGNNFYTEGPQVPEIILRDPPGSRSYAYVEKGSSYSVSSSFSTDFDNGSGFGLEVLLGLEVAAGGGLAGPVFKTDTKNSGKTGLSFSTSVSNSGEYVQTYEFTERVETSSDPGVVGAMGDIYIGKSYNYFYGETDNLKILKKDLADANGVTALGGGELKGANYTLGLVEGFIMNPDNSDTYFKFTQAHILNKLLPELESRRNNLFLTSTRSDGTLKYTTNINASDLRYGVAHSYDVQVAGGDTIVKAYYKMSDTDSILSYSFRPEKQTVEDLNNILDNTIYENDSLRYFNTQIGIWIDAIRLNEAEKAIAIQDNVLEQNISFDGAVGAISRSEVQTIEYNKEESRTKNMHFGAQGSVGFTFNSTGLIATGELSISHSLGVSTSENSSQTMEYGYTLEDGDVGDYYSMNVYRRKDNGVYNANTLAETKMEMPSGFDFGMLGQGVALVGGGIAVAAATSYNAGGGIPIVAGATVMAVAAGLSYIPYVSFLDDVKENGNRFSPGDIRVSSFDISSPIFSTLGGQTMCPFQDLEHTFFYRDAQGDSVVLHKPTLQREKPEITVEPYEVFNVPITDKAFFNIKLTNNTESDDDQWYTVRVDSKTNIGGAAISIDGKSANQTIFVPAGETVTKLLSVTPTDKSIMDYDSIGIIMQSTCQNDPTDFMPDIASKVYISAHFQAACTNVEILEPLNNWVINARDNDTMTVNLGDYNLEFSSFESFRFEYKASSGSIWVPVKYFVNDPLLANSDEIPDTVFINDKPSVVFDWDMTGLKDREYDIRVVSVCSDGSENESLILSGILDGQRPQVFGTPQPADGILNVDEDISIKFNEPIEAGLLNQNNFDIKGTLNYYQLKHEAYLNLNGNSDYAGIPEGISFNDKSFTIEFWMRAESYANSVLLSQGNDPATSLEIGIQNGNETYFKIGNRMFSTPFEFTSTVPAEAWQHMAYVYDYENGDVFIYQNDKIILEVRNQSVVYNNLGRIYLAKSSVTNSEFFKGSLHELRIWSKTWDLGDIYANQYTALSGNEVGLYGYWPMNEAFGTLAVDKAAFRHMEVFASWEAYPGGFSWDFSGNNYLEMYTGYFSIIPEMDYTLEFWFKDENPSDTVCLFSNQKGDGTEGNDLLDKTLSIIATADGKIWVSSKGQLFEAVSKDYFDNSWHHFSLVVRRRGNATAFIDGEPQNDNENSILGGISGGKMFLGAQKWNNINGSGEDKYYEGKLDEFRLWNLAKSTSQIRMDMNSKLKGDEIGLMVYYPFEGYYKDGLGVVQQQTTLESFVSDVNALDAVAKVGNAYSSDAPNMKDVRPVQSIAYDYVSSEDEIIISPKSYLYPQLEKNIIEITVEGVEDKFGNRLASPATWTAYVHRNQVRWEDEQRNFIKEIYKQLDFVSSIKNTGGQQISWSLNNLPLWLSASPSSGVINPESTIEITFTINPALNIGEYNEDIVLHTENGFDEKLPITVKVFKTPPNWKVDPAMYEHTMNMVGQVKIEDVLSTDIFDKVAVFVNDTIRGVANVRYLKQFDSYMVFLNVYGNITGEQLEFRLWDASVGQILDDVKPFDVNFVPNGVEGTTLNPVLFEATGLYRQYLPLARGWNWVSFNKLAHNQNNLNSFFSALEPLQNDQIKTHGGGFNNFDPATGWLVGGIDSIDNQQMYQIKIGKNDTVVYSGESIIPEDHPIDLHSGWNHIAYIPDLSMDVNDALRMYVANTSEVIKSQYAFAMYDPRAGWLGTLDVMEPGLGYMINVNAVSVLKYPNTTVFKSVNIPQYMSPPLEWKNNLAGFEGNLSIVAKLDLNNSPELVINEQMLLGAFINGDNRGYVVPILDADIGYDPFFLSVSNGMTDNWIEFKLYDGVTGNTYTVNETHRFEANAVLGSTQEPLILTVTNLLTGAGGMGELNHNFKCYPNPFNDHINIDFTTQAGEVQIDVLNATGALVKQIFNGYTSGGKNTIQWEGINGNGSEVSTGVYYIRFVSGTKVETVKISKSK